MINIIKNSVEIEIKNLKSFLKNINIYKEKELTIDITQKTLLNLNLPTKKSFIYIIKSINPVNRDIIKNIKDYKHSYAYNKDNCLYVGSSHNINKRLKEHLGISGYPKTYAMHLKKWWNYGPISIVYNVTDKYLQLCEDILWEYYKPLLGRQGKN